MPEFVASKDELVENIITLDGYQAGNKIEKNFHERLIRNTKYFVVIKRDGRCMFGANGFVAHKDNNVREKWGYGERSGGRFKSKLINILGPPLVKGNTIHQEIDNEYIKYCLNLGLTPSRSSRTRSYWVIEDDKDLSQGDIESDVDQIRNDPSLPETEKEALIKARRGQGKFRADLQKRWGYACAVTECRQIEVLRASHMKPWKGSTHIERLNSRNGLLLSANLDALFDKGCISFEDNGDMIVSPSIASAERKRLGIPAKLRLPLSAEEKKFLECHRSTARKLGKL